MYSWKPTKAILQSSNIYKMMQRVGISTYPEFWKWSVKQKAQFWDETVRALQIPFHKPYSEILDVSDGKASAKWLKDAEYNCADACFLQDDESIVLQYQKENGVLYQITQRELQILVNRIANSLTDMGFRPGDHMAIAMPMTVEAVAVYLAGIKAGMPIVTIADSFSPNEMAIRINITKPVVLFTQDYIARAGKNLPLYKKTCEANAPKTIVVQGKNNNVILRENDLSWSDFLKDNIHFTSVVRKPEDLLTVLFSSGTTSEPKAIPWNHTTPIKCASDAFYHHNIQQGDVLCWPTNLGWMMGPWLVFAALMNKASIALYYGAPTTSDFGRFVEKSKVTMLGVIPSFVNTWKISACMEACNWNAVKCFSSTGEVSNPVQMEYLMKLAGGKPVIEYCGGTEIGGGYISSTVVQENIPSTFSSQCLGGEFVLLNEQDNPSAEGEVFILPPVMGLSQKLLNRDHHEVYYKDTPMYKGQLLRRHGDRLVCMENGYYRAMGRVDDAMNLGGIKVSSVQIERVLNSASFVKESAAIAVEPEGGGPSELVIYYVTNTDSLSATERLSTARNLLRKQLNPLFKIKALVAIEKLPRTASNKIMRRTLRTLYSKID